MFGHVIKLNCQKKNNLMVTKIKIDFHCHAKSLMKRLYENRPLLFSYLKRFDVMYNEAHNI